jgi:hypothetical protein
MEHETKVAIRVGFEWSCGGGCVIALIAGNGTLLRTSIVFLALCGGIAFSLAAFEHGWNRAKTLHIRVAKTCVVLLIICATMGLIAYEIWPISANAVVAQQPSQTSGPPVPQQTASTPASPVPLVVNKTKPSKQDAFTFSGTPLTPDFADKFSAEATHPGMQLLVTAERPVQHITFQVHCNVPCVYSRGYGVTTAYAAGNVQSSPDSKLLSFSLDIPARLDAGQQLIVLFRSKDNRELSSLQAQVASENVDKPCVHPNLNIGELHADHVGNVFLLSGNPCIAVGKATITNSKNGVVYTTKPTS